MDVVQKLWGFCNTLRHDGINYGDYIEQLTYLLFLKLAEEKGLPQKFATEQKGAGQYFTPRPLIRAIVRCLQPDIRTAPDFSIHDPACGTGGFLIGAAEWMFQVSGGRLSREEQQRLKRRTYSGVELVLETRR